MKQGDSATAHPFGLFADIGPAGRQTGAPPGMTWSRPASPLS